MLIRFDYSYVSKMLNSSRAGEHSHLVINQIIDYSINESLSQWIDQSAAIHNRTGLLLYFHDAINQSIDQCD